MIDSASSGSGYVVWLALKVNVTELIAHSFGKKLLIVSLIACLITVRGNVGVSVT